MSSGPVLAISPQERLARRGSARSRTSFGAARFWQPVTRSDLGVVCADVRLDRAPTHVHEGLLLVAPSTPIVAGDGTGREVLVEPGSVHVVAPYTPVLLRRLSAAPAPMQLLLVTGARARGVPGVLESDGATHHTSLRDPVLRGEVASMLAELRRPNPDAPAVSRWLAVIGAVASAARRGHAVVLP
jgi:hypothetical protein